MELFQVKLFYHPSCDHMDPSADHVEEFFTLRKLMEADYPSSIMLAKYGGALLASI